MPVVFVIGRDWALRAGVRAELREAGVSAVGIESLDEAARAMVGGTLPSVVVFDAAESEASGTQLAALARNIPLVVVASRTSAVPPVPAGTTLLYRPVRVGEIVARVIEILQGLPA